MKYKVKKFIVKNKKWIDDKTFDSYEKARKRCLEIVGKNVDSEPDDLQKLKEGFFGKGGSNHWDCRIVKVTTNFRDTLTPPAGGGER